MIYTAIDTFYLTDEQLRDSPSRKDGIDEATETVLRVYGCDLIQESGILLRLPQAVMATAQVLFHRFYCKKSFVRFSAKRVAASCVWLAGKLEESPRRSKHIIFVFHRMECRRENLPIEFLDVLSKKYSELRHDLIRTERHLLKEMGFICHVEHPHKFISNYLATLEAPPELTQEAWNLANDSLRTTLCVRFKSEVVACGVVFAAARRHCVPLPEDPPWWTVFDADEAGIQEVCRVLAHLYSLPKAQYIPVYKDNDSFTVRRISDPQASKESPASAVASDKDTHIPSNSSQEKDSVTRTIPNKVKEKSDDKGKPLPTELDGKENLLANSKNEKSDSGVDRSRERERERDQEGVNMMPGVGILIVIAGVVTLIPRGVGKVKERDQEGGNVMPGIGILIVIAGVVTLIARGTGGVALGKVQDTQTRRNQGAICHETLTTTVRTHLVKKIGTGTIDQGELDPGLQGFAAWRPLGSADRIMKTCGLSSHWWLHWLHCFCTLDFLTCKIS